jgi:predicted nucleic acid-binding protein
VGWLIDTSIWIAVERGTLAAADIHAITRQDPVYLSPVNVAEIRFGLALLRSAAQKERATAMLRRRSGIADGRAETTVAPLRSIPAPIPTLHSTSCRRD